MPRSYEVEYKAVLKDRTACEERLAKLGAERTGVVRQQDEYFNHPCRDFAHTDEALRIRTADSQTVVTYKGPKIHATAKTRREIEFPLADQTDADCRQCLIELGFRPVAIVQKTRSLWQLSLHNVEFEIALDQVEQVGLYIELEVKTQTCSIEQAQRAAEQLAQSLELGPAIHQSYLEMLLEHRGNETSNENGC